jgi:hypothetical protein
MVGMLFKVKKDSEYNKNIKMINNCDMFEFISKSRIDGLSIYRVTESKSYDRFRKIMKIISGRIVDDKDYDKEHIMDKIRGHIELVSTLEDHMKGFYPSA